ncbi:MAG: FkbM family methyltransferase [Gammaproteobacteria bacterium]|nr:FkbM family methyltransferase [Gammaproteobacteria bacterium]
MKLSPIEKLKLRHRFWRYRYKSEVPSIRFVLDSDFAGQTLIDVGANYGVFSYYMSRAAGPDGKVIAFEAQPELGEHLLRVKGSFGLDNLTIVNKGLSSSAGTLTLHRDKVGSGRASFDHVTEATTDAVAVPVVTLDDYLTSISHGPVAFIKCDVEGHELAVFKGAARTLHEHGPALLFECHHAEAEDGELFRYLAGQGYGGAFFYVRPEDHRRYRTKGHGRYLPYTEFADHPYPRPGVRHRNYVFVKGEDRLRELLARHQPSDTGA